MFLHRFSELALDIGANGEVGLLLTSQNKFAIIFTLITRARGMFGETRRRRRPASTIAIPYSNRWPHPTIPVIVPAFEFSLNEKNAVIRCIFNIRSQIRFLRD